MENINLWNISIRFAILQNIYYDFVLTAQKVEQKCHEWMVEMVQEA